MSTRHRSIASVAFAGLTASLAAALIAAPLGARQPDTEKAVLQTVVANPSGAARRPGTFGETNVRAYGDAALVTYRNKPVASDGKPGPVSYLTRVFERQGASMYFRTWAERDQWQNAMVKAYGQAEADRLLASRRETLVSTETFVLSHRPDLSRTPTASTTSSKP